MKQQSKLIRLIKRALLVGLILNFTTVVNADFVPSENDTNFELDGNILADPNISGDDWSNFFTNPVEPNNAFSYTGILDDPISTSIFTGGGSKDVRPISLWKHTEGTVPDKNEILHAAAAAYNVGGELIVYLHGDRFANDGDAQMGVWFFQDRVSANIFDNKFTGEHRPGDVLMLAEFVNGGANANVKLYKWDPDDPSAVKNLVLFKEGQGGIPGFNYYATSNGEPTEAWPNYKPKSLLDGYPDNTYPSNSFFEGAINLSVIFGDGATPCFSTFLMETRSSHRADAQLKDFVIGSLDTCKLEVEKVCISSELNKDTYETLDHNYTYKVTNSGLGTVSTVKLYDNLGDTGAEGDGPLLEIVGPLEPGDSIDGSYVVSDSTLNPPTNTITAIGYIGQYQMAAERDTEVCEAIELSPTLKVEKDCNQTIESLNGYTVVKINYWGKVCNMSNFDDDNATKLTGVTVTDDIDFSNPHDVGTLYPLNDPNQNHLNCAYYSGSYYPSAPTGDQCSNNHTNTVTAIGYYSIGGETNSTTTMNSATCGLCDKCNSLQP